MIKTTPIRQLTVLFILLIFVCPLFAQEKNDSAFLFRSATGQDNCYVPLMGDGEVNKAEFNDVASHSLMAEAEMRRAADDMAGEKTAEKKNERFALKTNLLYYAILMPNVEIEWMFANRWSAALEFQGAWYCKNPEHKVYRVSTLMPEFRYWVIDRSRWHGMYVGIFLGGGIYDLCNGKKGHKGEGGMAGVSAGYAFPISKHLSLDAGIGVGYLRLRDKQYQPYEGHYLYQLTKNINYIGPLRLKLSLMWRF